jgi:hypothetical protein
MTIDLHGLWRDDALPVYIMDNHRAALWCWMQVLTRSDPYLFAHIDHHWDHLADAIAHLATLESKHAEVCASLDTFDQLRPTTDPDAEYPILRWDNYIAPFLRLYPRATAVHMAARDPRGLESAIPETVKWWRGPTAPDAFARGCDPLELIASLPDLLRASDARAVVNIDLDVFEEEDNPDTEAERYAARVPREQIPILFDAVRAQMDRILVVTIALSPECSGGWDLAFKTCALACKALGIRAPGGA